MNLSDRIAAYLDAIPPCIAGEHGDTQLYKVACSLFNGFSLSENEVIAWLRIYNQKCQPPWDEGRLVYKANQATLAAHSKPRGYLLEADKSLHVSVPLRVTHKPMGKARKKYVLATDATPSKHLYVSVFPSPFCHNTPILSTPNPLARKYSPPVASVAKHVEKVNIRADGIPLPKPWKIIPPPPPLDFTNAYQAQLVGEFANAWCYQQRYWKAYIPFLRVIKTFK
jgi:hypothetical protein